MKLLAAGIIGNQPKTEPPPNTDTPSVPEVVKTEPELSEEKPPETLPTPPKRVPQKKEPPLERPPDLTDFQVAKLRKQYNWVVHQLYQGIQCTSCGCRFLMEEMEQYRQHLDWHFRLNKKEKEATKMATYRKWYYELNDWILYQEVHETDDVQSSVFEEDLAQNSNGNPSTYPVKVPDGVEVVYNPTATGVEADDLCVTCRDPFEQYWDEEAEEWHLRNAISVDGKIYHPICYDDAKEGSGSDLTPTPVVEPSENPLVGQIKQEASYSSMSSTSLSTPSTSSHSVNFPTPLSSETQQCITVKKEPHVAFKAEPGEMNDIGSNSDPTVSSPVDTVVVHTVIETQTDPGAASQVPSTSLLQKQELSDVAGISSEAGGEAVAAEVKAVAAEVKAVAAEVKEEPMDTDSLPTYKSDTTTSTQSDTPPSTKSDASPTIQSDTSPTTQSDTPPNVHASDSLALPSSAEANIVEAASLSKIPVESITPAPGESSESASSAVGAEPQFVVKEEPMESS